MIARATALVALAIAAGCGGPTFDVDAPFTLVHCAPTHGAVGVDPQIDISIGFNRAVDAASADANISLSDAAGALLDRTVRLSEEDRVVVLIPARALPAASEIAIGVSGELRSADNVKLAAPFEALFTTADE